MRVAVLASMLLAVIATLLTSTPAEAAHQNEIRREASHLFAKANTLKSLFHAHYRQADNYRALDAAAHAFYDQTKHIREHAFQASCDEAGLREDIRRAQRIFGTLEHLAYQAEHCLVRHHRGKQGITRHVRQVMHETDYCLDEFGDLLRPAIYPPPPHHGHHDHREVRRAPRVVHPHPGASNTIRLGNSNIHLRFNW